MKRRAALATLLGFGGGTVAAPALATRPAAAADLLVWGDGGLWVGDAGGELLRLPGEGNAAVPPVPVVGGLWALQGRRRLRRWQVDGQGAWGVAARHDFDEPVHALAAAAGAACVLAAHGEQLSLLDAGGALLRRYDGTDRGRRRRGQAQALFHLDGRRSFVAAWPDLGEVWEIPLDPAAPPIYDGLVHDYRMGEAIPSPGHLGVRRTPLAMPMAAFAYADDRLPWIAGLLGDQVQIVHLDVRRRIAQWSQPGATPQAGLLRRQDGVWTWWLPVAASVQRVDVVRWQPIGRIEAPGRVRTLQIAGDGVWALCGDGAAATLVVWRGNSWTPLPLPAGTPCVLRGDAAGRQLLVASTGPSRVYLLDGEGRPCQRWTLPAAAAPNQLGWLPRAA